MFDYTILSTIAHRRRMAPIYQLIQIIKNISVIYLFF